MPVSCHMADLCACLHPYQTTYDNSSPLLSCKAAAHQEAGLKLSALLKAGA